MKNPIIEEKVRVQRILSKKSGSIGAYLKLAKEKAAEAEKQFGVKLIRSTPAEKISGSEAAA